MKTITSRQNTDIKIACELHTSKGRTTQQRFLAEGQRIISGFLDYGFKPQHLYVTQEHVSAAQMLTSHEHITIVSDEVMEKLSTASTPSGMVAIFAIPKQPTSPLQEGLVLAQIADPGNMGTLIRTSAAMNKKTIVIVEGCDPWSPKVIQASAGAIAGVELYRYNWQELVRLPNRPSLCALVVRNGKKPEDLQDTNLLLVVGNEAQGLPQAWVDQCEEKMTIPMPGQTESLNAAVAGSIALYIRTMSKKQ